MVNFYEAVLWIYEKFFASSQSLGEFIIIALSGAQGNVFGMNSLSSYNSSSYILHRMMEMSVSLSRYYTYSNEVLCLAG